MTTMTKLEKIFSLCSTSTRSHIYGVVSRVLFLPNRTFSSSPPPLPPRDSLYRRLWRVGNPRVSVIPVLDQWVGEGRPVESDDLRSFRKQLMLNKRFTHALQVNEWMIDKGYIEMLYEDVAVNLDLIFKVHGLEQTENYFNTIPITLRGCPVYWALLNCYIHANDLEKSEELWEKIKELGFSGQSRMYNAMLRLYSDIGRHEKLNSLVVEMDEKGIYDIFTIHILLKAYATVSDFEAMERLLTKIEADPGAVNWHTYFLAANIYLKAGAAENAQSMLRKAEEFIRVKNRWHACLLLLTSYASLGNKEEVYRMWSLYKKSGKPYTKSYLCMINSLAKLDDLDGAEKIYSEWEADCSIFDFCIPNTLLKTYCAKRLLGKAEALVDRLIQSGKDPYASVWAQLAAGYCEDGQMDKAVRTMKKAILASKFNWEPNRATLVSCLQYLIEKRCVEEAVKLIELLKQNRGFPAEILGKWVHSYPDFKPGLQSTTELGLQNSDVGGTPEKATNRYVRASC